MIPIFKKVFAKGGRVIKPVKLGYGFMGSGTTVWDSNREEHGDYKKVAHISDDGKTITFYDKKLPEGAKKDIELIAKKEASKYEEKQKENARLIALEKAAKERMMKYGSGGSVGVGYSEAGYTIKGHKGKYYIEDIQMRLPRKDYPTLEGENGVVNAFERYVARRKEKSQQPTSPPSQEDLIEADRFYSHGGGIGEFLDKYRQRLDGLTDEELAEEYVKQFGTDRKEILTDIIDNDEKETYIDALIDVYKRTLKSQGEYEEGGNIEGSGYDDLSDKEKKEFDSEYSKYIEDTDTTPTDSDANNMERKSILEELLAFEPTARIDKSETKRKEREWFDKANAFVLSAKSEEFESIKPLIIKIWNEYIGLDYPVDESAAEIVDWHNSEESQSFLDSEINQSIYDKNGNRIYVTVDDQPAITADEFIAENTAPDVFPITDEEIDKVKGLEVGEYVILGFSTVKRVPAPDGGEDDKTTEEEPVIFGHYNELGYCIYKSGESDKELICKGGNSAQDSMTIVPEGEGLPVETIKDYGEKVGKEYADSQGLKWDGMIYTYKADMPELISPKFALGGLLIAAGIGAGIALLVKKETDKNELKLRQGEGKDSWEIYNSQKKEWTALSAASAKILLDELDLQTQPQGNHIVYFAKGGEIEKSILDKEYFKEFTLKGNGRRKYTIFNVSGDSSDRQAAKKLFPTMSYEKHKELAESFAKQYKKIQSEYNKKVDVEFEKKFHRPYEATDYKVSGIVRDEFSDEVKNELRKYIKYMGELNAAVSLHNSMLRKPDKIDILNFGLSKKEIKRKKNADPSKVKDSSLVNKMTLISKRAKEIKDETGKNWKQCIKDASAELKKDGKI